MSNIFKLIKAYIPGFKSRGAMIAEYLAKSTDIGDLERRMDEISNQHGVLS